MQLSLYFNGNICTLDSYNSADWIVTVDNLIFAVGKGKEWKYLDSHIENKINLEGKTVLPAFTDSHIHLVATALKGEQISLDSCSSLSQVIDLLEKNVNKSVSNQWVLGTGYNANLWTDGKPHREILDKIFPDSPVALASKDLHTMWINSKAMGLVDLGINTPDPDGGKIERDPDGAPSGILREAACEIVFPLFLKTTFKHLEQLLPITANQLFKKGITGIHAIEEIETFVQLQTLHRREELPFRITCHLPQQDLEKLISAGLRSGYGDEWLRLGGVKFFADGSLGSQTAELFEAYENRDNYYGISMISETELKTRVKLAAQNGLSAVIHAIGDRAVNKTLNALQNAREWQQQYELKQRMEHAQLIKSNDLPRFSNLGVFASMQPSHIADDVTIAETYWGKRCKSAYPVKSLLDHNITIVFGSDSPVTEPDPLKGIYTAVERKAAFDTDITSWQPEQCITIEEAVKAYTINPAIATGEDKIKGTLTTGKLADFIVLDRDIFKIKSKELLETRIDMTVLNGTIVHNAI